jgi:excisionase family DNA binding protein
MPRNRAAHTLLARNAAASLDRAPFLEQSPVVHVTLLEDDRLLLTVVEAARRLEISRSLLYELMARDEIQSIRVGRLRRVPAEALSDYISRQQVASRRGRDPSERSE